jgi:hypothetical protein
MSKRICILLDDDVDQKLRIRQANSIKKTSSSVSFSMVINDVLRKNLK